MRLIYSLLLIFTFSIGAFAQKPIKIKDVDVKLLREELTRDLIKFRDTGGVVPFINDELLLKAAKLQGEYCLKNNSTSHYQTSKKNRTVDLRVRRLGGYHGNLHEIITEINLSKIRVTTYHQLSELTLRNALRNESYNKFLRSKRGKNIGMYLNKNKTSIYMVIVLGTPPVFEEDYTTPSNVYGIKSIQKDVSGQCNLCLKTIDEMPHNVSFDLTLMRDTIYFVISNEEYLRRFFVQKTDGFAVDIIRKKQYPCGDPNVLAEGVFNNGYLLPPIYKNDIFSRAKVNDDGVVFVAAGVVPPSWRQEDVEFNLLFLKDNFLCRYNTFFQIPFGDSEMLHLPFDLNISSQDVHFENTVNREMTFVIPFEQGKSKFNTNDLKPLVDSLRLASYTITNLEITAYSSIEGTKEKNEELQQRRANSIVSVISENMSEKPKTTIRTVENWVDFFAEVQDTDHAYLAGKTEVEIIEYVNTHRVPSVDAILKNHRKAIVNVSLQRKSSVKSLNKVTIDKLYNDSDFQSSDDKYYLIEDVFQLGDVLLLEHLQSLTKTDIRWSVESKAKIAIYLYQLDKTRLKKSIEVIDFLLNQKPGSTMLMYNNYLLKLLAWEANIMNDVPQLLKKQIWSNKKMTQDRSLRLRFNFDMLEAKHYEMVRNTKLRNKSVYDAFAVTTHLKFDDEESFIVGKFFANNGKYKEALELLTPKVNKVNVNEDLLFLYINLTIIKDDIVGKIDYRATLANAALVNQKRFCAIFNSSFHGGITFQLLKNKYLKRSYCEICE